MALRSFAAVRAASFVGLGTKLADIDLPRIGHGIGVGEDEIHAVIEVESAGGGFDAQRRPKILFEPHVFYRNLSGAKREQAVTAGLAYQKWGTQAYGPGSVQYDKLLRALKIDESAALKACSWGMGQILGENHVAAGFPTVQDMVASAVDGGEAAHLQMMVNFIKYNRLDVALRNHDWRAFARGYNGAGYEKNQYHTKLERSYSKWRSIRDTPWSPSMAKIESETVEKTVSQAPAPTPAAPAKPKASVWATLGTILAGLFPKKS
jgi:hypothetical protein